MFAQPTIIDLRSAQRLEGKIINNEEVRELIGNVHFTQPTKDGGRVYVWCDRAVRYMEQNKLELYGNVKVLQNDVTLYTNEGLYNANTRTMESHSKVRLIRKGTTLTANNGIYFVDSKYSFFSGDVELRDSTSQLHCDELFYYDTEAYAVARNSVHLYNFVQQYHLYGDSLIHYDETNYTIIALRPKLVKIDTSAQGTIDTTVITSITMEHYQTPVEVLIAQQNVQMVRSDIASRCGRAVYYRSADSIVLFDTPILWSSNNQVTGDTIYIKISENQIRRIDVHGHAMAASLSDSLYPNRFNQLSGKYLTMHFFNNTLHFIDVRNTAISLYYLYDNGEPNGANKTSGDQIIIDFEEGTVASIRVLRGVEGQYFPEQMLIKREDDYNLDGFRWFTNRPRRIGLSIE